MSSKLKFLFISIVFVLFLLLFNTNVFATFDVQLDNETISFPDIPSTVDGLPVTSYVIYYGNGSYRLSVSNGDVSKILYKLYYYNPNSGYRIQFVDSNGSLCSENRYTLVNGNWVYKNGGTDGLLSTTATLDYILYSTTDVYDWNGELFFQQPPQEVAPQMVLAPIVEEMEMKLTLQEIIQILPLIIVVVVCFLGLRKALQMLLDLLRRCLIILIL